VTAAVEKLAPIVGVKGACEALDIPRAFFYGEEALGESLSGRRRGAAGAEGAGFRGTECRLACLHEERSQDSAPRGLCLARR
jgi:hypothetical protein